MLGWGGGGALNYKGLLAFYYIYVWIMVVQIWSGSEDIIREKKRVVFRNIHYEPWHQRILLLKDVCFVNLFLSMFRYFSLHIV